MILDDQNLLFLGRLYKDLPIRSKIHLSCDYCGKNFTREKKSRERLNANIQKDSCGSKECKTKKKEEVSICLFGAKNFFQSDTFNQKSKSTNLKKYGSERYFSSKDFAQKRKDKLTERYGADSPLRCEKIKKKQQDSCLVKYGSKNFSKTQLFIKKYKETSIKNYGCESPVESEKLKAKSLEKYGTNYPIQSDQVKNKVKASYFKNYGVSHPSKSEIIKQKIEQTNLKKYGFKRSSSHPEVKKKIKATNLARYGNECVFKNTLVQEKIRNTNIQRYGQPRWKFGKTQKEITDWLNSYGFNFQPDGLILEGKELDLYDPAKNFALEYCGLYWHNENSPEPRTRSYHHDKWKRCKEKDIRLLTIFDDEWKNKKEICKSLILSKLGIFEKRIQARKCETKKIEKSQMKEFCDQYHLQGGNLLSEVCFGLFHNKEMIGVVDMGRHHRKKNSNTAVLTRLCFKTGLQVIGGSGKLFKACCEWCRENGIEKIVSWSDNRYSDGTVYERLGFMRADDLPPDYYYVEMRNPKKRISKQSQSKKNSECPKDMTELEWANYRGLSRIWDCGKTRWEFMCD